MPKPTDELIQDLVADARPVTPLQPPLVRALLWVLAVVCVFAVAVAIAGTGAVMLPRLGDMPYVLEFAGTLTTAITAIIAAMTLSIPGRSDAWALLPLPSALLWIAAAAERCFANPQPGESIFASAFCFEFIVSVSIPLALTLFFVLRRIATVNLLKVTALGGLGVAAFATALLQFFHPEQTTTIDFSTHVVATVLVVVLICTIGQRVLSTPRR
ncbi:MAG: DUF1109 family protein [Alphaproteobacteria bacterium]|nr:DUF1109 family protein [Alphaproteobacteria bacterium]